MAPRDDSTVRDAVSFAASYAFAIATARTAIHFFLSPYSGDIRYYEGCGIGLVGTFLATGLVISFPLFLFKNRTGKLLSRATALVLILAQLAAGHYHAMFNRLPSWDTLTMIPSIRLDTGILTSVKMHGNLLLLVVEFLAVWALAEFAARMLKRFMARSRVRTTAVVSAALALPVATIFLFVPDLRGGQVYYGSRDPLLHILDSSYESRYAMAGLSESDRDRLLLKIQKSLASESLCSAVPLKTPVTPKGAVARTCENCRDVIFVLLESTGYREAHGSLDGVDLMPNFKRIESESSVSFTHFYSAGEATTEAMHSLFPGMPAAPSMRSGDGVWNNLRGFPRDLAHRGYDTLFMNGSDLNFGAWRDELLPRLGFLNVAELNRAEGLPVYGWGLSDDVMFGKFENWITAHRASRPKRPFFALLLTVSTHDPFVLPPSAPENALFQGADANGYTERYARALRFSDRQLGAFYRWYLENEKARGTILVVTGDHTLPILYPGDPTHTTTSEIEYNFHVPFLVSNLPAELGAKARTLGDRPAGQADVPDTLLPLLNVRPEGCSFGRNLLSAESAWPSDRYVLSTAGEGMKFFYVHQGSVRWLFDGATKRLQAYDLDRDPKLTTDLAGRLSDRAPGVLGFIEDYKLFWATLAGSHRLVRRE